MTISRLSRHLVGIFAICYVSAITVIICFFAFNTPSPSIAGGFVAPPPPPCPGTRPALAPGTFQSASGTIKSINGQTLQIVPKTPGTIINATYSNTTRMTQETLVTTPPASVLQKGVDVSVEVIPNPNGTFTATSITLMQSSQSSSEGGGGLRVGRGAGGGCSVDNSSQPRPGAPNPNGQTNKPTSPIPGNQPDNRSCFAKGGLTQASSIGNPSVQDNKTPCRITGTVAQFTGTTLIITDRQQNSHSITLTSGINGTKILQITPATPSALKVGISVTVMGPVNNGIITASRITIGSP